MRRVRPPELPGDAEARERVRQQEQQSRARWAAQQRISSVRGERERMASASFLDAERRVLARLEATTDEAERRHLTAQAAELRRLADEYAKEAQEEAMRDKAKQIREQMRKRLGEVAQRMALVKEADDEQFPPDYQAKRQAMRAELRREWNMVETQFGEQLRDWSQQQEAAARAKYEADPIGDAATESRRVSRNLEIASLAEPFIGQPTMARNRLMPEARRLIALGVLDKAGKYVEAAKRAGVVDSATEHALESALDESLPHRKQALAQIREVQEERDLFLNDMYTARIVHSVGSPKEQAQNSTAQKLAEWRHREGLVATTGGGQQSGDGGAPAE